MHHTHLLGLPMGTFFGWLTLLLPSALIGYGVGRALRDSWIVAAIVTLVVWAGFWLWLH